MKDSISSLLIGALILAIVTFFGCILFVRLFWAMIFSVGAFFLRIIFAVVSFKRDAPSDASDHFLLLSDVICLVCKKPYTKANPHFGGGVCQNCWARSH